MKKLLIILPFLTSCASMQDLYNLSARVDTTEYSNYEAIHRSKRAEHRAEYAVWIAKHNKHKRKHRG